MDNEALQGLLETFVAQEGRLCVLTGAGISAESGIPTFRGPEGYWQVGSKNYHPQELATLEAFEEHTREVWRWYLYRRTVCRRARPNAGHEALVRIEEHLGGRFVLITQNVDGLHARAGSKDPHEIHGNTDRFRCADRCTDETYLLPEDLPAFERDTPLDDEVFERLRCPDCGGRARPHVLWFDEYYEETFFRSNTAMMRAEGSDLLIVAGTSGSTNLPMQIGTFFARKRRPMIDVNPNANPFGELAVNSGVGLTLRAPSGRALPRIAEMLGAA